MSEKPEDICELFAAASVKLKPKAIGELQRIMAAAKRDPKEMLLPPEEARALEETGLKRIILAEIMGNRAANQQEPSDFNPHQVAGYLAASLDGGPQL